MRKHLSRFIRWAGSDWRLPLTGIAIIALSCYLGASGQRIMAALDLESTLRNASCPVIVLPADRRTP